MAKPEVSPAKSLVLDSFKPKIAFVTSKSANAACEKNGLQFTQLIQPFCTLTADVTWQEPGAQHISPKHLRISPVDLSTWKPPQHDLARNRRILNSFVSQNPPVLPKLDDNASDSDFVKTNLTVRSNAYTLVTPKRHPWYESWREAYIKIYAEQHSGQYDFLNQFFACVLVISPSDVQSVEHLNAVINELGQVQSQHQYKWPQTWFAQTVLKFYLVLHDNSADDLSLSEKLYQNLRTTYGANFCHLLKINSHTADGEEIATTDVWSSLLTKEKFYKRDINLQSSVDEFEEIEPVQTPVDEIFHPLSPASEHLPELPSNGETDETSVGRFLAHNDMQNVQVAINEFIGKSLLPHAERIARTVNESIVNRRGMSKSILSATKRLFGSGAKVANALVYSTESPEMLSRKLADLYFLFGHYDGAYQLYHQIKKDFQADSAWMYYASSLEMAAISHFMMTQLDPPMAVARSFPLHYITEAITFYTEHCRMPEASTRCAILLCECLKQIQNYGEAAAVFIRMTKEDCDLRSALMLEQAAYSFISLNSPRKYALHCVLAGHRYAKAGLRSHSVHCYLQAHSVYKDRGWKFAEDHVQYTISRHQFFLGKYDDLASRLVFLFSKPYVQSVSQIELFLKEFIAMTSKLNLENKELQNIQIPTAVCSKLKVVIACGLMNEGEFEQVENALETVAWDPLEEQLVKDCIDPNILLFRPHRSEFNQFTDNTVHPIIPSNETCYVELPFYNPLPIDLVMKRLRLKFDSEHVRTSFIEATVNLPAKSTKYVRFAVSCSEEQMICFEEVHYELELGTSCVAFKQNVELKGPRLNSTPSERWGKFYAKDLRNKLKIIPAMPLIKTTVQSTPTSLFHSQKVSFNLVLNDASSDSSLRSKIAKVVVASANKSSKVEILNWEQLSQVRSCVVRNKSTVLQVDLSEAAETHLVCTYTAPADGDYASLNLMVMYILQPLEDISSALARLERSYRTIKLTQRIPLLPSLELQYSFLKSITSATWLGVLQIKNVCKGKRLLIDSLETTSRMVKLDTVITGTEESRKDQIFTLNPAHACSLVLRFTRLHPCLADSDSSKPPLNLNLHWQLVDIDEAPNVKKGPNIFGHHLFKLHDHIVPPPTYDTPEAPPLVFQVRHSSSDSHDFETSPSFIKSVELIVTCNRSGQILLKLKKASKNDDQATHLASSQDVTLVGQTCWNLKVSSSDSQTLVYKVALSRQGVFNIAPAVEVLYSEDSGSTVYNLHSPFVLKHKI